jgi:hypothetical protein
MQYYLKIIVRQYSGVVKENLRFAKKNEERSASDGGPHNLRKNPEWPTSPTRPE